MKRQYRILLTLLLIAGALFVLLPQQVVTAAPLRADSDDFVITVKTDNPGTSDDDRFIIGTTGTGYNYNVDCNNDGTNEATGQTGMYTCDYSTLGGAGTYTIRIKDNAGDGTGFPRFYMLPQSSGFDPKKLLSVEQWGTMKWTSMNSAFRDCTNLAINATDAPDLSNVTSLYNMFYNAGITTEDFSTWDTSNVTNFSQMFGGAQSFNGNITTWDTSSATNMSWMFLTAFAFNQDISGWNTGNVTDMTAMFNAATSFNRDISAWDTSSVTDMKGIFKYALAFDQNLSDWDMSSVTDAELMFDDLTLSTENYDAMLIAWNAQTLQSGVLFGAGDSKYCLGAAARQNMIDTDNWDISDGGQDCSAYSDDFVITVKTDNEGDTNDDQFNIRTNSAETYNYNVDCNNDGTDEATGVTGSYTCDYSTLGGAGTYTVRIKDNVGDGTGFPAVKYDLYGDRKKLMTIEQWGTGKWSTMARSFYGCENMTLNATDTPDLSNVTSMEKMFRNASSFNTDIGDWDTSNVTNMNQVFYYATSFDQDISGWDVSNVVDMDLMFLGVTLSTKNYDALLNGWDAQTLQSGVPFHGGNSKYCLGETARANMVSSDSWTITDGGKDCTAYDAEHFVITVKTDNVGSSNDDQFTIPTTGSGYNYNVDCNNDGTDEATGQTGNYTCTYGSAGTYTIRIKDNAGDGSGFPQIYFNDGGDELKLLSVDQWGTGKWTSMARAFLGCQNMNVTATDNPDLALVTDMEYMFSKAENFNGDISGWDVSTVEDMQHMFDNAEAFNQDISGWDTGSVTTMNNMFDHADVFNADISGWDVSSVTNMTGMFYDAFAFNADVGGWDVSSVSLMDSMFRGALAFDQDLSGWNTGNVTYMEDMFRNAQSFDQDLGSWDVSSLVDASRMFDDMALSTENYDALLTGWNAQTLQSGVTFSGGNSHYCTAGTARQNMIDSDGWTITDGGGQCAMTAPTLTSPAQKELVDTDLIFFTWEPVENAARYTVEIKKVSDNSVVYKAYYAADVRCDATSCSVPYSEDLPSDKYKWHITPWDEFGNRGPISVWLVFSKRLATPVLRSPGDGNTVVSYRPTFKWYPVYETTEYVIELLDDGGTRVDIWSWKNPVCGTYCEFRVPAGSGLDAGDYQWRVRARNDERASDWSGTRTFTFE